MIQFFINLDRSPDRQKKFDNKWSRWKATDYKDLEEDDPIFKRMCSFWNINPNEHKAKSACFLSHYYLLKHIVSQKLNQVVVCEDDAQLINPIPSPEKLGNDFTYLGGFFSHLRMTDGPLKDTVTSQVGLNPLDRDSYRMIMFMSYYIPRWEIAQSMIDYFDSKARLRAIDVMSHHIPITMNYWYPACFVETPEQSTIRDKKNRHCDTHYYLSKKR